MSARRFGFTLLELMIALVLTSVVAIMAYASAQVSVEAATVIRQGLRTVGTERAARQTMLDLLHNVRPAQGPADTGFALTGDTLVFTAAGAPPLDPERDWRISIRPGAEGLELAAVTLGRGPVARAALRLPRVTRWEVRVLPPRATQWQEQWVSSRALPEAVAVTLWEGERPLGAPLTVRMPDASSASSADFLGDF